MGAASHGKTRSHNRPSIVSHQSIVQFKIFDLNLQKFCVDNVAYRTYTVITDRRKANEMDKTIEQEIAEVAQFYADVLVDFHAGTCTMDELCIVQERLNELCQSKARWNRMVHDWEIANA